MKFVVVRVALLAMLVCFFGCSSGFAQSREEPAETREVPARAREKGEGLDEKPSRRRWTDEQLAEAVKKSRTLNQVFKTMGLRVGGSQWATIAERIRELGMDTSHFKWRRVEVTDAQLAAAVKKSKSFRGVARSLGIDPNSSTCQRLRDRIRESGFDTTHFRGQGWSRGTDQPSRPAIPLEEILVADSKYLSTVALKERLIEAGLLKNRCAVCDLGPEWRGKRLVMRIDHINGVRDDNRLENLRLICPNCDSQLETFAGRNKSSSRMQRGLAPLPDGAPVGSGP